MRAEKIKKIKDLLENAIKKARFGLEREGTDTTTEEYQQRIENLKESILKKVGVTKEEYELAERFFDTELDLLKTKIRVGKLETKKTKWGEVEEKPEIKAFDQSQIKDLEFSQLKHRDEDHTTIVGSITDLKEEDRALAEKIQQTKEELKIISTPKIRHGELLAIGKDDHHPEEHNLESHVESDWKDKFKRLIGGQRVDDLHTHAFPLDKPWVGEPWGVTKGDTDVWYLKLDGTNSPSANINWGGYKITNLADPTADQDAATKAYVDAQISGENWWDRAGTVLSPHNAGDSVTGVNITSGVDPGHTHSIYLTDAPSDGTMYGRRDGAWERMTLMPPVEEYWDITEGLPPLPEEGDRYISDGEDEELGWYDGYIYEWDGEEWVESVPEIGWMVWLLLEMVFWVFMSGGWREVGWDSYWSIENDQTSLTGDKTGSFDLTTTGAITGINVTSGADPGHTHTAYQPIDADLSAIAALGFVSTSFLKKTAANTWALDTTTYEPTLTKGNLTTTTTGLAITGGTGAVIGSGATINADTGYGIPTTAKMSNWDTAYGWGNHASAGYLTSVTADSPLSGAGTAASHLVVDLSSKQNAHANLTSLSGLTYVSASFVKMTAADTFSLDTNTYSLSSHDHAGVYEPADADLSAIAALGFTSIAFLKKTAANTWALDTNTYLTSVTAHNLLSAIHGDTVSASPILGDILYGDATPNWTKLAGNTTTTKKFLTQTGTGAISAVPAWDTLVDGDIPSALTGKTYNGLTLTANADGFEIAGGTTSRIAKFIGADITFTGLGTNIYTFPGATSTLASLDQAETFTNKVSYNGLVITANTGAITTGSWHATTIAEDHGGTGVANGAGHTLTVAGPFSTVGHYTLELTASNNTAVTLPTTGTLMANLVEDTTPQLGGELDLNSKNMAFVLEPGADVTAEGMIATVTVDTNTNGIGSPLALAADGHFDDADADSSANCGAIVLALEAGTGSKKVLFMGIMRQDAWNWTLGAGKANLIYLSATAGTLTQTQPAGTDDVIQPVGWAITDDCIFFNPSLEYFTHT